MRKRFSALRKLWRNEGTTQMLRVTRGKAQLALFRRRHGQGLMKRYIPAIGRHMFLDIQDEGISKTLFYRGVHEPLTTQWVKDELAEGMTVLDIGANLGYYVLLEASLIGEQGRIYAVEPVPKNYDILHKNLALNRVVNATTARLAISGESGQMAMRLTPQTNWAHLPHQHLDSERATSMLQNVQDTTQVQTMTLDEFVEKHGIECINFLRMDVEGYEIEIIKGGLDTLSSHRPMKVLMEVHPFLANDVTPFVEMLSSLFAMGFRVKTVGHAGNLVYQWPSPDEVVRYVSQSEFDHAPHILFSSE